MSDPLEVAMEKAEAKRHKAERDALKAENERLRTAIRNMKALMVVAIETKEAPFPDEYWHGGIRIADAAIKEKPL